LRTRGTMKDARPWRHLGHGARMRPRAQVLRQQWRIWMFLVEIFEDRERLRKRRAAGVDQRRPRLRMSFWYSAAN